MSNSFYVEVDKKGFATFYYNMMSAFNREIIKAVGEALIDAPISTAAKKELEKNNFKLKSRGPARYGVMSAMNYDTKQVEYMLAEEMKGITAAVASELAEEVLERAKYYCPVDTGYLRDSGRIEVLPDGSARIYFDCPYSWYVHEFTWKNHKYPTRAKFLTDALYEVYKEHGLSV